MAQITAWRIVAPQYVDSAFSGKGAEQYGGRFNSPGRPLVYLAGSISLAMLELLVQANKRQRLIGHVCIPVSFGDASVESQEAHDLPEGWDARPYTHVSQRFGDSWLKDQRSLVLCVPSVVVLQEYNYLLNPRHPDFDKIEVGTPFPAPFDQHLI